MSGKAIDVLAVLARHRDSHVAAAATDAFSAQEAPRLTAAHDALAALLALAKNFEVIGPDVNGIVWLVLKGNGTSGKGLARIGTEKQIVAQVALHLEADRIAAVAKAGGAA
jgi:hypothetical protein